MKGVRVKRTPFLFPIKTIALIHSSLQATYSAYTLLFFIKTIIQWQKYKTIR